MLLALADEVIGASSSRFSAAWLRGRSRRAGSRATACGGFAAMMEGRNADTDPEGRAWFSAFRQGLQDLGWVEGRNFRADYRWPAGALEIGRPIQPPMLLWPKPLDLRLERGFDRPVGRLNGDHARPGIGDTASLADALDLCTLLREFAGAQD